MNSNINCINCNKNIIELSILDLKNIFDKLIIYLPLVDYIEEKYKNYIYDLSNNNFDLSNNIYSRNDIDLSSFIFINSNYSIINNYAYLVNTGHIVEQIYIDVSDGIYNNNNNNNNNKVFYTHRCFTKNTINVDNLSVDNTLYYQECIFNNKYRIYNDYKNLKQYIIENDMFKNREVLDDDTSIWFCYNDLNYKSIDIYNNNYIVVNIKINSLNQIDYIKFYETQLTKFF